LSFSSGQPWWKISLSSYWPGSRLTFGFGSSTPPFRPVLKPLSCVALPASGAAFALAQAVTLWRWRKDPVWLAVCAGVRFSDLFTDVSYILAVPSLTRLGWILLVPLPFLNLVGVVIMLCGYRQARTPAVGH
jgi:hypothetical protein